MAKRSKGISLSRHRSSPTQWVRSNQWVRSTKWVNPSQSGPTARFAGYYLLIIAECTFFFWFLGLYFNSFLLGIIDCKFSNLHATNSEEKIDNITLLLHIFPFFFETILISFIVSEPPKDSTLFPYSTC